MIKLKNILNEQNFIKKILTSNKEEKVLVEKNIIKQFADKVDSLGLGSPISTFLVRIAAVESCYGLNPRAKKNVWQIDLAAYKDTKDLKSHPNLQKKFDILKKAGIDWPAKTYSEITTNRYLNCIAARLYLGNQPGNIPSDLKGQANYWKTNYNTIQGGGSVEDFIEKNSGEGLSGCVYYV